jgi:hypothetical protein
MSCDCSPRVVSPIAAKVLSRLSSLSLRDVNTVPHKWRPLLSRYATAESQWTISSDGLTALLVDDWNCLHVFSLLPGAPTSVEDNTYGSATTHCVIPPEIQLSECTASPDARTVLPEVTCSVSDAAVPATLRYMLSMGQRLGHVERCQVWRKSMDSFGAVDSSSEAGADAALTASFPGALAGEGLRPVAPHDIDGILSHW